MSEQSQIAANLAAVQTAAAQGERLAVVETEVRAIRLDLTEVKLDVKTLLASDNRFQGGSSLISKAAPWVALVVSIAVAIRGS